MEKTMPIVTSMAIRTEIHIDSYENSVIAGSITNDLMGGTVYFRDVAEMAALLDNFFDTVRFPQATYTYRRFRPERRRYRQPSSRKNAAGGPKKMNMAEKRTDAAGKASFVVHVQFRQHATWQGSITWVDKGTTQQFRSVLEMIRLMTEAVESQEPQEVQVIGSLPEENT